MFEQIGGFNETEIAIAFNDIGFCLRVKKVGYRILWIPYAELNYHESLSRGKEDNPEKIRRFEQENTFMMEKLEGPDRI